MAGNKYLTNNAGFAQEVVASQTSTGAADAGKIPALNGAGVLSSTIVNSIVTSTGAGDSGKLTALDASGRLDTSVMPTGIAADVASIATSESLAAGDFVNIFDSSGAKVRKADATVFGKHAMGFVLTAFTHPTTATVYFEGSNSQVTGQTAGDVYLGTTGGVSVNTPPTGSGNVQQNVGVATSATNVKFEYNRPIILA